MDKKRVRYKDTNMDENSDDKYILLPYNRKNVLIKNRDIEQLLKRCGLNVKVHTLSLLQTSLTHKSYIDKSFNFTQEMLDACPDYEHSIPLQKESYEKLEFYGDSVVDKPVREYICERYSDQNEGVFTTLKINIVDTKGLAKFAKATGLTPFIIVSKQVEITDNGLGRASDNFNKILEDVFEAFLGALDRSVIDRNLYEFVRGGVSEYEFTEYMKTYKTPSEQLLWYLLETQIDWGELFCNDTNYKNQLMQYYHKMKWGSPVYGKISHDGPAHKRMYKMCVYDKDGKELTFGKGKKKKDGEQIAAKNALIKFGVIDDDQDEINLSTKIFV